DAANSPPPPPSPTRRSSDLTAETGGATVNKGAASPAASPGPTPQAPGDPGGSVADVFARKGKADASEPTGPNRSYVPTDRGWIPDRKSTRLNSSHVKISYAV